MLLATPESPERWFSMGPGDADGSRELPVYLGETYIVKASNFSPQARAQGFDYFEGAAQLRIVDDHPSVVITVAGQKFPPLPK